MDVQFSKAFDSVLDGEQKGDKSAHLKVMEQGNEKSAANKQARQLAEKSWKSGVTVCAKVQHHRSYIRMIGPDVPLSDLASLNWVSHKVPSSSAENEKVGGRPLGTGCDTLTLVFSELSYHVGKDGGGTAW